MRKRALCTLTVIALLFQLLAVSFAVNAAGSDVSLSIVSGLDDRKIYEGNTIDLVMRVSNNLASTDVITDVTLIVDQSASFYEIAGNYVTVASSLIGGQSNTATLRLKYKGVGSELRVSCSYKKSDGNTYEYTQVFNISNAVPADSAPGDDDTKKYKPVLGLTADAVFPTGNAGSKMTITLPIKNSSNYGAKNIVITPDIGAGSNTPFVLEGIITKKTLDKMEPNEVKNVTFEFNVDPFASAGTYPITFKYQYLSVFNDSFEVSETVYIKIANNHSAPKLVVSRITRTPQPASAGETVKVSFDITNAGTLRAKGIKATINGLKSDGFILGNSTGEKYLQEIGGSKKETLSFNLLASQEIQTGNYSLELKLDYQDDKGNPYNESYQFFLSAAGEVVTSKPRPSLAISNVKQPQGSVAVGQDFEISFDVVNTSTSNAQNVTVSLDYDAAIIGKSLSIKSIPSIPGNSSERLSFKLNATSEAMTKNYPIAIKIKYEGENEGQTAEYTASQFVGVLIERQKTELPSVVIDGIRTPDTTLMPGDNFSVTFDLINNGKGEAKNIKVSLTSDQEIISKSLNTVLVNSLASGASKQFTFNMSVAQDAAAKAYPITINLEYESTGDGNTPTKFTGMQYIGIYVDRVDGDKDEDEAGKTAPKLIIDRYSLGDGVSAVMAGQSFTFTYSLFNTSRQEEIRNLIITISSDDGTFSTEGSNSYFVEKIGAQQSVQLEAKLSTKADAAQKSFPLSITLDYEDSKGNTYSPKESIGIPVIQQIRLEIGDVSVPFEVYPGQPVPIFVEFYNMGKATLYNLMVKTEGDFDGQQSNYFVGNFEPGRSDSYDGMVTPTVPGLVNGAVVFTYEDAAGTPMEVRKEFSLNVMEMQMPIDMPPEGMPMEPVEGENEGKKILGPFGVIELVAIGGGLVLTVVAVIVLRKRHKRKKEMMFDEVS